MNSQTSYAAPDPLLSLVDLLEPVRSAWYCHDRDCDGRPHPGWEWKHARAAQHPPVGDWLVWLIRSGRGFGKTRAGAEWVIDRVMTGQARRIALVARTAGDIRGVMVEGESGILACSPHDFRPRYEPSKRRLTWPNGAQAETFTSESPGQLRGPEHDAAWCDELSSWADAGKGDRIDTTWNNLMLGLRLPDSDPRCVVTTTPKPNRITRELCAKEQSIVRITVGSTYDNLENLAPSFKQQILSAYEGTRIGRQELSGELLSDIEGALWTLAVIDATRGQLVA